MSETTTLTPVDIDQRLTDLTQQVADLTQSVKQMEVMVMAAVDHLPTATAQKLWEKREGVVRILGGLVGASEERIEKTLDTKCMTVWIDDVPHTNY